MKKQTIIFDLGNVLFYLKICKFVPLKKRINILKKCHAALDEQGNHRNQLLILSNCSALKFNELQCTYPNIIKLFDGHVIASQTIYQKPDPAIYHYLLEKFQLDPKSCIFIDDTRENVITAQTVGMTGIVFDDAENVENELKKINVI